VTKIISEHCELVKLYHNCSGPVFSRHSVVCACVCRRIANAVHYVMNGMVSSVYVEPFWLFAVPLYHFLSNAAKPFTRSSEHSSVSHRQDQWWGIADFDKLVKEFKWRQTADM